MNHEEKKYTVSVIWRFIIGFIITLAGLGLCMLFKTVYENIQGI